MLLKLKELLYLGTIGLSSVTNLLTPTSTNSKNQISNTSTQIGSTWAGSGLNIDLDNIMGSKAKQTGPAPTMNQLASNSPQHQIKLMSELYMKFLLGLILFNKL